MKLIKTIKFATRFNCQPGFIFLVLVLVVLNFKLVSAATLNCSEAEQNFKLGVVNAKNGNLDLALAAFNKALKLDSNNPEIYYHLSRLQFRMRANEESLKSIDKAIELNPQFAQAYAMRALCRYVLSTDTAGQAIYKALEDFEKASQLYRQFFIFQTVIYDTTTQVVISFIWFKLNGLIIIG